MHTRHVTYTFCYTYIYIHTRMQYAYPHTHTRSHARSLTHSDTNEHSLSLSHAHLFIHLYANSMAALVRRSGGAVAVAEKTCSYASVPHLCVRACVRTCVRVCVRARAPSSFRFEGWCSRVGLCVHTRTRAHTNPGVCMHINMYICMYIIANDCHTHHATHRAVCHADLPRTRQYPAVCHARFATHFV